MFGAIQTVEVPRLFVVVLPLVKQRFDELEMRSAACPNVVLVPRVMDSPATCVKMGEMPKRPAGIRDSHPGESDGKHLVRRSFNTLFIRKISFRHYTVPSSPTWLRIADVN